METISSCRSRPVPARDKARAGGGRGDMSAGGWLLCARLEPRVGGVLALGGCGGYRPSQAPLPFTVTSSSQECAPFARAHRVLDAPTLFLTRQGGSLRRSLAARNDRGARGACTPSSRSSSSRFWRRPSCPTRTPPL